MSRSKLTEFESSYYCDVLKSLYVVWNSRFQAYRITEFLWPWQFKVPAESVRKNLLKYPRCLDFNDSKTRWKIEKKMQHCARVLILIIKVQNFAKSSPNFWLYVLQSKVRWIFCKILWPSQNIWTLYALTSLSHWRWCQGRVHHSTYNI